MEKKGFSLLELMVSLLIISATIVTTIPNISQAVKMSRRARTMVTAIQLARNLLNDVQLEGKINERKDDGSFEDFEGFSYEYQIEKVKLKEIMIASQDEDSNLSAKGDLNVDRLFKISLSVLWEEGGDERRYDTFSFLYSEK